MIVSVVSTCWDRFVAGITGVPMLRYMHALWYLALSLLTGVQFYLAGVFTVEVAPGMVLGALARFVVLDVVQEQGGSGTYIYYKSSI